MSALPATTRFPREEHPSIPGVRRAVLHYILGATALCASLTVSHEINANPLVDLDGTIWEATASRYGIDPLLLFSISLVESQTPTTKGYASPSFWALRAGGEAYHPKSLLDAREQLTRLLAQGVDVDVCALQINTYWQRHRVARVGGPQSLLNRAVCLDIGAQHLAECLSSTPDIELAVGRYHHWENEARARRYGRHVIALWTALLGE